MFDDAARMVLESLGTPVDYYDSTDTLIGRFYIDYNEGVTVGDGDALYLSETAEILRSDRDTPRAGDYFLMNGETYDVVRTLEKELYTSLVEVNKAP